jgi:hypothetical protein
MSITIQGEKYIFNIISQTEDQDYFFAIQASSKSSGRTSYINNLNVILSEFGIEMDDPKVADSTWVITKEEAQHYVDTATQFLFDRVFLDYLENRLDEDRMLGEWENVS